MDLRTYYWDLLLVGPLQSGLRFLATDLGLGAALAIILFTIIIRLVLLPLTLQQMRSAKAMQRLQPEIKALQKKYGKDREKITAETMALYKQHGYNPAAGCLPLVLQMPILFALYAAMRGLGDSDPAFQAPWLWLASLQQPDVIHLGSTKLPGALPILAAATQWVQQRMMTPQTDDPQQKMQNQMMQFMPLMMLWIGLSFSSGLALYWVTQNVFGIVQQYFFTGWGSLLPHRGVATSTGTGSGRSNNGLTGSEASKSDASGSEPIARADRPGVRSPSRGSHRDGGRNRRSGGAGSGATGEGRRAGGKR